MKTLQQVKDELIHYHGPKVKIMEVCGTHTASIFKHGIKSLVSPNIQLISGPGCPVCVTTSSYIDKLVEFSLQEKTCVLTFGDMMKVKGSQFSLSEAKAIGGKVTYLYSPFLAIQEAVANPQIQYIFAAVGFETTTPIYALMIEELRTKQIKNLKLLTSIKTMLPALTYLCEKEEGIDAFLCPGHVSVITGCTIYQELAQTYHKPFVVAGFEGEHILAAIDEIIYQITTKKYRMKNLYVSAVSEQGNQKAQALVKQYFEETDDIWRGVGIIKKSGLRLRKEYLEYDAGSKLEQEIEAVPSSFKLDNQVGEQQENAKISGCNCKAVLLGRITPVECPLFQKVCTPINAIGPCMVSSEGACQIWYKNR